MKRFLLAVIVSLFLFGGGGNLWAEGQKILSNPSGTYKIAVPEKAPDFLKAEWESRIVSEGQYGDGTLWAVMADEKDGMSVMSLIIGKRNDKGKIIPIMVAFCVAYDAGDCADWYFDEEFLKTWKPSGIFSDPVSTDIGKEKLRRINEHFNSLKI